MESNSVVPNWPFVSDIDQLRGFIAANRRKVKTCAAMQRLIGREATDDDRDWLVQFVDRNANQYPITCDALGRVLSGG